MPDQKEDLLGAYTKLLASQGKTTMADKLMPSIRFMTSETGIEFHGCCPWRNPKYSCHIASSNRIRNISFRSVHTAVCIAVDHRHQKKVNDFDSALDQLFAQFGDSIAKLQKLLEIHLDYPVNAMTRVCKKIEMCRAVH